MSGDGIPQLLWFKTPDANRLVKAAEKSGLDLQDFCRKAIDKEIERELE